MKVAVIGCGPAGLAAVHAAYGLGADVTIFSPGERSPQSGPLLLQRPIPGITTDHPVGYIRQIVIDGSIIDYRYKLYGDINISINGDILAHGYAAWDHFTAYRHMWNLYMNSDLVRKQNVTLSSYELNGLCGNRYYDLIVNTAPLNKLCRCKSHNFTSATVIVTPRAEYPDQPENTIVFNAGNRFPWVRSSKIFGNEVTEWLPGTDMGDNYPGGRKIRKPISTDCKCWPRMLLTGRFGSWHNERWVDTAYYDTYAAITSMRWRREWDEVK